jgi:hypothetical protein
MKKGNSCVRASISLYFAAPKSIEIVIDPDLVMGKNSQIGFKFCCLIIFFQRRRGCVLYSTLFHPPPLRFYCVEGCWDRTQDCYEFGISTDALSNHSATSHLNCQFSAQVSYKVLKLEFCRMSEPECVNLLRSPGTNFQRGGPVRQPYLT